MGGFSSKNNCVKAEPTGSFQAYPTAKSRWLLLTIVQANNRLYRVFVLSQVFAHHDLVKTFMIESARFFQLFLPNMVKLQKAIKTFKLFMGFIE